MARAVARSRTRAEPPGRRDLKGPEARGTQERLLPESLRVEPGGAQSQRALETQEERHPWLHQALGPRGLDVCAEIN